MWFCPVSLLGTCPLVFLIVYKVHGPNTVITLVFITGRDAIYICRHIFSTSCRIFSALGFRKKEDPKTNKPILFLSKQHERNRIFRWFYQHTCPLYLCFPHLSPSFYTLSISMDRFLPNLTEMLCPGNATLYVCYVNITKTDVWTEEKKIYEGLCCGIS